MDESNRIKQSVLVRLYRDLVNHNWLVQKPRNTSVLKTNIDKTKTESKSAPQPRPSLKVSIPINIYRSAMENQKKPEFKMPSPVPRPPQPRNPTGLRMVRHPTLNRDTVISPLNLQVTPRPPKEPGNNKIEVLKTVANKTYPGKILIPCQKANSSDCLMSLKHNLPFGLVRPEGAYKNRMNNKSCSTQKQVTQEAIVQTEQIFIVIEEEFSILQKLKEKNFTEEDIQILQLVKDSGVTQEEVKKQLDRLIRQKERLKDSSDYEVIDLESNDFVSNDVMEKLCKDSARNKDLILSVMKMTKQALEFGFPLPPITCMTPAIEQHSANREQPAALTINEDRTSRPCMPFPNATVDQEKVIQYLVSEVTKKFNGLHTKDSNTQCTQTEDESKKRKTAVETDHADRNSFQRAPIISGHPQEFQQTVIVPQQTQTMFQQSRFQPPQLQPSHLQLTQFQPQQMVTPQFQPPPPPPPPPPQTPQHLPTQMQSSQLQQGFQSIQIQPPQHQQTQIQPPQHQQTQIQSHVAHEQTESSAHYYKLRASKLMQKRTQVRPTGNHHQSPFENIRAGTRTAHTPPVAIQQQEAIQMFPNDPRRQSAQSQMALGRETPHFSRVLSSHEANQVVHGSQDPQIPHSDCNWSYPPGYYSQTQGNFWQHRQ